MSRPNVGVCSSCKGTVPVDHEVRDGRVYLLKHCPECGDNEALISTDAAIWQAKRDWWRYDSAEGAACALDCMTCGHSHEPAMVFVDVTNRCNMNCPICIANVPAMGFKFDPPMGYFDKVFAALGKLQPSPRINLFGGEPTVREDIFEIIELARRHGLRPRIVTNGLRLADEEFCKRMADAGVPLLFALDGLTPDVYDRLRKNPGALDKKLRAMENLTRYSRRKNTVMTCVARHINEHQIGDLIQFCHDRRAVIKAMHMIPLTETWEEGEFETDVSTTIEDVEKIVAAAFEGNKPEFWSAGLPLRLYPALRFFSEMKLTFGGVHPNCESMTVLVSDGGRYRPLSDYTRGSVNELLGKLVDRTLPMQPMLNRLNLRRRSDRLLGLLRVGGAYAGLLAPFVRWRSVFKCNPVLAVAGILWGLARGGKLRDAARPYMNAVGTLNMIVLPFEEYHSVESERLRHCKAAFAYLDPETDHVGLVPVCAWSLVQRSVLRRIAAHYDGLLEPADAAASAS